VPTQHYEVSLFEKLRDNEYAAGYLTACYEDSVESFLLGLMDLIEVHGGIEDLSKIISLSCENLRLGRLRTILEALGLKVQFRPK